MDTTVSAHTLLLVCWPTVALLCAFAVLFTVRQGSGPGIDGSTRKKEAIGAAKLLFMGVVLLGAVFLIPDAGDAEHRSFFAVAQESIWGRLFEWPAAWCSAKIIVLSISALLVVEAMLKLAMRAQLQMACTALLVLAVFPVLLGVFGFYQFVKAVF